MTDKKKTVTIASKSYTFAASLRHNSVQCTVSTRSNSNVVLLRFSFFSPWLLRLSNAFIRNASLPSGSFCAGASSSSFFSFSSLVGGVFSF